MVNNSRCFSRCNLANLFKLRHARAYIKTQDGLVVFRKARNFIITLYANVQRRRYRAAI